MDKKVFKWTITLSLLLICLLAVVVVATAIGPANISVDKVAMIIASSAISKIPVIGDHVHIAKTWTSGDESIIMLVRLPRVLLALLVGASLAVAGVAAQAIFKNPMADPYILGVSSGASVGAAFVIVLGFSVFAGSVQAGAFVGAMLAAVLVFTIARTGNKIPVETLILSGVAISAFFSAVTSFLMYISGRSLQHIVYWVMGAFWNAGWSDVYLMLPFAVLGSLAILAFSRDLNVLLLGDESAAHLGTNVGGIKVGMLALTSLIAAAAVSVSGIIGFVGLVIPHMMRILVGPDHRILVPSSVLMGAMFMVSADTFSRMIVQPTEIPVGIITALIGAPFFIYLLVRKKKGVTG
jgi:iron complex transport system permease protein